MKKVVGLALVAAMLFFLVSVSYAEGGVPQPAGYEAFADAIDMDLAERILDTISAMGDNPDIGNRSSGSAAEKEAAAYIRTMFDEIGLQNVTVDTFAADNWSFHRGRIYYTDEGGAQQYLLLGGYATHLQSEMQPVSVVDAGRGTAADYEGLDVAGKVVLIDINQRDEWWISHPAMEAHLRGALAVLACNVGGYAQYDDDTIGSQDVCGPYDAAAFGVSKHTAAKLRALIAQGGGEAEIVLDVESIIRQEGESQNVWGEIPGKTDEAIYLMAHYDGYYHSYFDDAVGVGYLGTIAKALVDSGYQPDKTIRFIAHGAEEWGRTDTEYDWAIGAFQQITQVRPEWAEKAFAVLNLDGMYPIEGGRSFTVKAAYELAGFASSLIGGVYDGTGYTAELGGIPGCWTEDFAYNRAGIPSIVTADTKGITYREDAYHASTDHKSLGLDKEAYALGARLFGAYALGLDQLAARPVDFVPRLEAVQAAYLGDGVDFDAALAAANVLTEKINGLNARYGEALVAGNARAAAALRTEGMRLNVQTHALYAFVMDTLTAFDWEDNIIFPFEQNDWNIEALEAAIACLLEGDAQTPVDDLLYAVDYNWYAYDFSRETYAYNVDRMYGKAEGTWGEGMIRRPNENLYDVIHALMDKAEQVDADLTPELKALNLALENQLAYRAELDAELAANVRTLADMLRAAGQ